MYYVTLLLRDVLQSQNIPYQDEKSDIDKRYGPINLMRVV